MDATGNAGSGSASSHGDTVSSVAIEFLANKRHSNAVDARSGGTTRTVLSYINIAFDRCTVLQDKESVTFSAVWSYIQPPTSNNR